MIIPTDKIYYPMLLSEEGMDKQRSSEEYKALWKKYLSLSPKNQDILVDEQMSIKIKILQDQFHLSAMSTGYISLFIRKIFFKELTLEECEAKIGSMLVTTGGGDPNHAKAITSFIQKEILTIEPKLTGGIVEESVPKRATMNLPILQALSQYERLGNQLITKERIRIKSQSDLVRPSISYWIKYYRDELGVGHHDSVLLGNFLFRSENGKKLAPDERERLKLLLKSLEGNFPLVIDTERQEVIFPPFQGVIATIPTIKKEMKPVTSSPLSLTEEKPIAVPQNTSQESSSSFSETGENHPRENNLAFTMHQEVPHPQSSEDATMRFSSRHIFPVEREAISQEKREKKSHLPPISGSNSIPTVPVMFEEKVKLSEPDDTNPFIIHSSSRDN